MNFEKILGDTLRDLGSTEVATLLVSDNGTEVGAYSRIDLEGDHIAYINPQNPDVQKMQQAAIKQSLLARETTLKLITAIIKN
ncbi:hypothetical protein [Roseivirga misakiensis]|uniref:Uncharacterized protein n=1 Tax=Roseivirga misakiensis TaxID=1563681 RepID=A0A1E5SZY3_9BACT|nr:hypothetical protein [Roseivirga misakiensis]OEK04684.1 hypothetical protein BFP71_14620 [Roseivirga misakiensis]